MALWAIAIAVVMAAEPCRAQSAATSSFNHFTTGFPLTGAHSSVDCSSCHLGGRFKSTPRACFACHNGTSAQGKSQAHPKTLNFCEGCHQTSAWGNLPYIDHVQATAACADCHNGTIALGKPANHVVTAAPCDGCHKSTANFAGATTFNHAGIVAGCASCHNGVTALGKPANHVPTIAPCESCHKSTVTWLGAAFTHAATDVNCSACHNGSGATGLTTPPHIPVTGVQCSNCHVNTAPGFTTYTMNHQAVSASRCDSCHNGSYGGEGTKGAQGTASFPGHVVTNGSDCITCHASAATSFTSWAGGAFTHAASDTNCSNCHNGATATGLTTPPHVPVSGVQCSNCHTNTAASFTTYTMNHAAVSASRCDSCHNGSYTGQGSKGAFGTASFQGHIATNGKDCVTCHASAATSFTSWAGGAFTHAATDTNCSSCHNGTTATGLTTPPHIPVTGVQCSNCHTNTAPSFTTYTMTHSAVQRQPLQLLPQRLLHRPGHQGCARNSLAARSCRHQRQGLRHLSCQRRDQLHQLGGRGIYPRGDRHQLLELPQRHHGDRSHYAAAYPGDRRSVQQLSHQHRAELHHLHDEPFGGERQPL